MTLALTYLVLLYVTLGPVVVFGALFVALFLASLVTIREGDSITNR